MTDTVTFLLFMNKPISKYFVLFLYLLFPLIVLYYYHSYYLEGIDSGNLQCTVLFFTGLYCPGCGSQRSLHHLLHGEIIIALRYNALFVIGLPFLLYLYYIVLQLYILRNVKLSSKVIFSTRFALIFIAILLIYFILRNLNYYPFTYLAPPN